MIIEIHIFTKSRSLPILLIIHTLFNNKKINYTKHHTIFPIFPLETGKMEFCPVTFSHNFTVFQYYYFYLLFIVSETRYSKNNNKTSIH